MITAAVDCTTSALDKDVLFFHLCENLAGSLVTEGHSEVVVETDVLVSDCIRHTQFHKHTHTSIYQKISTEALATLGTLGWKGPFTGTMQ